MKRTILLICVGVLTAGTALAGEKNFRPDIDLKDAHSRGMLRASKLTTSPAKKLVFQLGSLLPAERYQAAVKVLGENRLSKAVEKFGLKDTALLTRYALRKLEANPTQKNKITAETRQQYFDEIAKQDVDAIQRNASALLSPEQVTKAGGSLAAFLASKRWSPNVVQKMLSIAPDAEGFQRQLLGCTSCGMCATANGCASPSARQTSKKFGQPLNPEFIMNGYGF